MKKVIVAMSGGVDSSVAAALLQQQGFEVEGIFMKNWSPDTIQGLTDCPWEQDQADAAAVCEKLGIPFRSVNFEKEYKERVVDYFLREYAAGRTPNPDVMCNKEIKFAAFLEEAKRLGAEYIATGHYVRKEQVGEQYFLKRGLDANKDQSYFLWNLSQEQVASALFPVGELEKTEVRRIATELGLPTASKKDSQGICFIGHIDLKKFLAEHITAKEGKVYLLSAGSSLKERLEQAQEVGNHHGTMFYTIGERAGELLDNGRYRKLRDGKDVPPVYVLYKDFEQNHIYVTEDAHDPHLYTRELLLEQGYMLEQATTCQIRYQQKETIEVEKIEQEGDSIRLRTKQPVFAAAEGQSVVLYHQDRVVGGGIINQVIL